MDSVERILSDLRRKNVSLWMKAGRLHYRAPGGTLTQQEVSTLRAYKSGIVAILERTSTGDIPNQDECAGIRRAPPTFSQLAHWNTYGLAQRPAIRQIANATRLNGWLNVDVLTKSLTEVVRRHEALRTRIVAIEGSPVQEISASPCCYLAVGDLTTMPADCLDAEVLRAIDDQILAPVDTAADPLLAVRLLRLREDEYVLITAMEHMISDIASLNILLRDLFACYGSILNGGPVSLPEVAVQFGDYAMRQRIEHHAWMYEHAPYWNEHLSGCQRARFSRDISPGASSPGGWGTTRVNIGPDLTSDLRAWCRRRRTTLVMGVFTAYVALVLRWCKTAEAVLQYQSDGRGDPGMDNAIGYFASPLFLRMGLRDSDTYDDLLNRVTDEYCNAYQHADRSYFAAQVPRPDFTRNTVFNWIPRQPVIDLSRIAESGSSISHSPIEFEHPYARNLQMDAEPWIMLCETAQEIAGKVCFPLDRFSSDTMEKFGDMLVRFIRVLISDPGVRVKSAPTVTHP